MAHFVAFVCANMNKCHVALKDENFQLNRNLAVNLAIVSFAKHLYGANYLNVQQIMTKLVVDHFIAGRFDIILCSIIYSLSGHKTGSKLSATIVLALIC